MSETANEQRKPLAEWISSFKASLFGQQQLLFGETHSTTTVSSDDYLIPALRVAFSLADQICKAEEAGQSPMPSSDWMDSIVVILHPNINSPASDVETAFNNTIRADFLPSFFLSTNEEEVKNDDNMKRIYSLGIVFYEIFSGGARPAKAEEFEQQKLRATSDTGGAELPSELLDDMDPLPFDQGQDKSIDDLVGELDILEKSGILDDVQDEYNHNLLMDDIEGCDLFNQNPIRKRQTHHHGDLNACSVSVEPLRAKGLPGPLCDLVANMIGCADGTFKEETYLKMSDVRDDLRLMLDKPLIYLRDQDMGMLSTFGLQIGRTMFGRNADLSTVQEAYHRSVSSDSELAIISGVSGSGKSLLANEFGKYVLSNGGILLFGKFDQLQQGKPFSALASAFDVYCGCLLQNSGPSSVANVAEVVASQLKSSLGGDAYHLAKIIPNLAIILGPEPPFTNNDEDCFNALQRLEYLLCQFVQVISTSFAAPVTLFLDDLQWADPASIAALNQLLLTTGHGRRFFFLGCCREGEINEGHPVWKLLSNATTLGVCCTNVKLDCMDEETLNTMVSESLCLSPRLTRSLSNIIYRKTKGNPLFASRLMLSLSQQGLLRPSLILRKWEWDKEKIQRQKLPDDVAMFLSNSIRELPEDVKSSLCALSCFGASSESSFIKTLEKALEKNLLDNLDIAVSEGLLDKNDHQYSFSHDHIQEAAYNMMDVQVRRLTHFNHGMALAPLALAAGDDDEGSHLLLTAATQLNLGGPTAVQDMSQIVIVATLNLRAGKKALEMSNFEAAYAYFNYGISFLRKNHCHWDEQYGLSLELFVLAAKCALVNGNLTSLNDLSEQVQHKAHSLEDKLSVMYFVTCSLAYSSRLPESIEKGLDILSKLGVELRGCGSSTEACVQETKELLSAYTHDELLNSKRMTDPTMIMAMKFLGKLELGMTQIMPKKAPHVAQRMIQLSLLHGMSPVSPIGFVHLGSYMAKLGDISGGYHYVQLALSLLDKVGSRESAGEVICIGTQVRAYVEPLQAALEYHNEGYTAAMASGDIIQAALNRLLSCANSVHAGVNLQTMREQYAGVIKLMQGRKLVIFMIQAQYFLHSILKLIGTDEEPKYVSAEEQKILATNNSVMATCYFHKAFISFMLRSHDGTEENIEKYLACIGNTWANLFLHRTFQAFYIGLISFWLARKSRDGQQQQWQERGKLSTLELKKWAESSQWTFQNKWYLLEAEDAYCNNNVEAAKTYYEKAIASAKDHKFINEEALACELAAYFYLELGDNAKALQYFMLAHEKYCEWGALGKSNSLFKFVKSSIFSSGVTDISVGRTNTTLGNSNMQGDEIENAQWYKYMKVDGTRGRN